MPDLGTGLAVIGAAVGSKELIQKILGPTADYLGDGLKDFTKKRVENIGRIFSKAGEKLGSAIDDQGSVPPRILKEILEEGSFVDDELSAEYFGGILASSRTGIRRDDRSIAAIKRLETMSTYEIRTHYILYILVRDVYLNSGLEVSNNSGKMGLYIPESVYLTAMNFEKEEHRWLILSHSVIGLNDKGLITNYKYGRQEFIQKYYKNATAGGLIFTPTPTGAELFLMANGARDRIVNDFITSDVNIKKIKEINIIEGAAKLTP